MKIAHLADLHFGIQLHGYSLIEDQRYICREILKKLKEKKVDAVIIAGDVFDRSVPSAEATVLLSDFLNDLHENGMEVFMIAGNHDSGDRLSFGMQLFERLDVHIAGSYQGKLDCVESSDDYGKVYFWLMPFLRPANVNRYLEDAEKTASYTEAADYVLKHSGYDPKNRNVLVMHQFVTGAVVDENGSEELIVGGLDQISADIMEDFDYVALGHIHRPQKIRRDTIRYAGTPLKYSLGEIEQTKSFPIIELKEKGDVTVTLEELKPLHEIRKVQGTFADIVKNNKRTEDYMHVVLTDEEEIDDAIRILRNTFPNILRLEYDNHRTRRSAEKIEAAVTEEKTPYEIFADFFKMRNGMDMSEEQKKYMQEMIETVWNEEERS